MEGSLKPNIDPEIIEMEKEIQEIVCAPIVRTVNGLLESEIYLANSWLWSIHSHISKQQGDTLFSDRPGDEKRQRLAGIANRLELDAEQLLGASPYEELRLILDALKECERTGYNRPD